MPKKTNLAEIDTEKLGIMCGRYLLHRFSSRIPIKRLDLVSYLRSENHDLTDSQITTIINASDAQLRQKYGFQIRQIGAQQNRCLLLLLDDESVKYRIYENEDKPFKSMEEKVLLPALSHIFMSGGTVDEDNLWKFLETANMIEKDDSDLKKRIIKYHTKRAYLEYVKISDSGIDKYLFKWGERATLEMPKMEILKIVTERLNHPINHFYEQFQRAQIEDAENFPNREKSNSHT